MITGKFVPKIFCVSGSLWLGPYDPKHPPITFEQITKYLFVSIGLLGPTAYDHQPSLFVIGFKPATNWSPVNAWKTKIALSFFSFRDP